MTLKYTRITSWQESEKELRDIRHEVFVIGQNCPPEEEFDDLDASAVHFLVKDADNKVYASARLIRDHHSARKARIGRFAVYPQYRGQGIGRKLVKYVISFARSQGILDLELSAQTYIQELYASFGFESIGEVYDEVGIPHIRMAKVLGHSKPESTGKLGEDSQVHRFNDHAGYLGHLIALLRQAQHRVLILSKDLESKTLDHPQVLEALSGLARKSRSTFVRILIHDPKAAVAESNQLLVLSRRLTTSIEIKMLNPEIDFPEQVYVLTDEQGLVLRHSYESWEGFCCYSDSGTVKRLTEEFQRLMAFAEISQELRNFSI
jgi:predicted GNAT family N-acyltransferase